MNNPITRIAKWFSSLKRSRFTPAEAKAAGFTPSDIKAFLRSKGLKGSVSGAVAKLGSHKAKATSSEALRVNAVRVLNKHGANLAQDADPDDENLTNSQKARIREALGRIADGLDKAAEGAGDIADEVTEDDDSEGGEDQDEEGRLAKFSPRAKQAARVPFPVISARAVGKAVMKTTTAQDKTVRKASQKALRTIGNAAKLMALNDWRSMSPHAKAQFIKTGGRLVESKAEANMPAAAFDPDSVVEPVLLNEPDNGQPDFSFLSGAAKMQLIQEYKENGGLGFERWFRWYAARLAYCEKHGAAPEAFTGRPIVIPAFAVETVAEARKRLALWASGEASFETMAGQIRNEIERVQAQPDFWDRNQTSKNNQKPRDLERLGSALDNVSERLANWKARRQSDYEQDLEATVERFEARREGLF